MQHNPSFKHIQNQKTKINQQNHMSQSLTALKVLKDSILACSRSYFIAFLHFAEFSGIYRVRRLAAIILANEVLNAGCKYL